MLVTQWQRVTTVSNNNYKLLQHVYVTFRTSICSHCTLVHVYHASEAITDYMIYSVRGVGRLFSIVINVVSQNLKQCVYQTSCTHVSSVCEKQKRAHYSWCSCRSHHWAVGCVVGRTIEQWAVSLVSLVAPLSSGLCRCHGHKCDTWAKLWIICWNLWAAKATYFTMLFQQGSRIKM